MDESSDGRAKEAELRARVDVRRARFRDAVERLSGRAQQVELVRLLLVPGSVALVGGFVAMFLGWYGAARTHRGVEQVPYLISGGLIGLGLVLIGGLLLASAFWMTQLQRFAERSEERARIEMAALEDRLRREVAKPRANGTRRRSTSERAVK